MMASWLLLRCAVLYLAVSLRRSVKIIYICRSTAVLIVLFIALALHVALLHMYLFYTMIYMYIYIYLYIYILYFFLYCYRLTCCFVVHVSEICYYYIS
jgi:hypothetical protein